MSVVEIQPGQLIVKDPADSVVYLWDWDTDNLAASVTITQSTWTLAAIAPASASLPTKDNDSIVAGSRKTQVRLAGGTAGARYSLTNTISTNESPVQIKERSIEILVENL